MKTKAAEVVGAMDDAMTNDRSPTLGEERRETALRLVRSWMDGDSGYDEAVWPAVQSAIERNRLSDRKRFDG